MWVVIRAKFKGNCRRCYKPIKKHQKIEWHTEKHTARHVGCDKGSRYTYGGKARKVA